jgi:hypothetical protein
MTRSGYRGAVTRALRGARGQDFLREMLAALDSLPERKLIMNELEKDGQVCAIGAVGRARGLDMTNIDPSAEEVIARIFGIAEAMAREIMWVNDYGPRRVTPESRYNRVREWVSSWIRTEVPE